MERRIDFTEGEIVRPLIRFVGPVFCALFLQALYGAVDLMIVGKFAESADVSAVATGSMIMMTITNLVSSLAMGMTILLGQKIGERKPEEGGRIVGSGILLFLTAGILMTVLTAALAPQLAGVMHAPAEAFGHTTDYIRICGTGIIVIISYNLIGSIFRGIGDSATPFMTVLIACICNIAGDLLLVAGFGMGTRGAIRWDGTVIKKILLLGIPIALQDLLVGVSFLVIMAIVNSLGLICSAGVGVAEKVCGFIMLVPAAFMQSMSAIAAQNIGAGKPDRAVRGLFSAIGISTVFGVLMFYVTFFHGDLLSSVFANDPEVIAASHDYLKAYAIDCMLTCFLFCFIGFFNGVGYTGFVMMQGIAGAFLMRVPVSFLMSRRRPVSLFHIGLATPCSSLLQITLCFICFAVWRKRQADRLRSGTPGPVQAA